MKICTECKIPKDVSCFHKKTASKDGLNCYCKDCARELKRHGRALRAKQSKVTPKNKACTRCGTVKTSGCFYKFKYSTDGLRSECKECSKLDQASDAAHAVKANYRERNRSRINKTQREWYAKHYKVSTYRLRKIVSKSVRCALVRSNGSKHGESTFEHLPYTVEELKLHLESLWESWMHWGNYGKYDPNRRTWQIDHIEPQSKLPFDYFNHSNFQKCWRLSNLRPLDASANMKKGNRCG